MAFRLSKAHVCLRNVDFIVVRTSFVYQLYIPLVEIELRAGGNVFAALHWIGVFKLFCTKAQSSWERRITREMSSWLCSLNEEESLKLFAEN
jgi:hypothetical protein